MKQTRIAAFKRPRFNAVFLPAGLAFLASAAIAGCKNVNWRSQSPDRGDPVAGIEDDTATRYIRSVSRVNGLNFAQIEGIGLVTGLNGTGSNPAPSWQKDHLLEEMKSRVEFTNPSSLINSIDTSIVLVRGMIPPGARKGDPLDLEIVLPPNSETTSLEGGSLLPVRMKPMAYVGKRVREGKTLALGAGGVVVDAMFEVRQDEASLLRGWIPGGGRITEDRELSLILTADESEERKVTQISQAINNRFTTIDSTGRVGVANPQTNRVILLAVPEYYRQNVGRYVEVVQCIAWGESVNQRVDRMELLDRQIDSPEYSRLAAMRLEAMGREGHPALRRALLNPNLEVRFHAAQALAYQGQEDGVEILAETAAREPAFRWNALAALAALDGSAATRALTGLMAAESAEARYGAFRAMHGRSPDDPLVKGEMLSGGLALHVIPGSGPAMFHLTRTRRPEVVIFNDDQFFSKDLMWVQPGLTVRGEGNGAVSVTLYGPDGNEQRLACSNRASELVRTLGNAGCSYSTIVNMMRSLKKQEQLDSRLVIEALPKLGRTYDRSAEVASQTEPAADGSSSAGNEVQSKPVISRLKAVFAKRPGEGTGR